jgi:hypothetical protein
MNVYVNIDLHYYNISSLVFIPKGEKKVKMFKIFEIYV